MMLTTLRGAASRAVTELIARSNSARAAVRRFDGRRAPDDVRVLCYHGITAERLPVEDPCFTTVERFEAQMHYLAENFEVRHLDDAFDPDQPHDGPVACVTFDDGFVGVHDHAFPVLRDLGIRATAFLVTDFLDTDETVWFGALHQAIIETTADSVVLDGQTHPLTDPSSRSLASISLQSALKALDAPDFTPAFDEVMAQLRRAHTPPSDDFRMLSSEQVRAMESSGLIRFGAHSATHQILTRTTPDLARSEISSSVSAVRSLVESPSTAFAYPNGGSADYDDVCVDELKSLGIQLAVTTEPGANKAGDDPFGISRIVVGANEGPGRFPARVHRLGPHLRNIVPIRGMSVAASGAATGLGVIGAGAPA